MRDDQIRQDVLDELNFEPSVNADHIGVMVESGVVTLTGHVGSYAEKVAAERVAQTIKGVHAVAQELQVVFPGDKRTGDDELATRAANVIKWNSMTPEDTIKIKVEKGWITLSGQVDWYYQRTAAENALRKLVGVKGVSNLIAVKVQVDNGDIKRAIEEALTRNAEVEAQGIRVLVSGNKVTLEGKVHAWSERGIAERAAWAVPGVMAVEDRLEFA